MRGRGGKRKRPTDRSKSGGGSKKQKTSGGGEGKNDDTGEQFDFTQFLREAGILDAKKMREGNPKPSQGGSPPDPVNSDRDQSPKLPPEHVVKRPSQSPPNPNGSTPERGQNGTEIVRLDQDDLAVHVPQALKSRIVSGEFVKLALLLKGAVEL